jgi:hypothetical protein
MIKSANIPERMVVMASKYVRVGHEGAGNSGPAGSRNRAFADSFRPEACMEVVRIDPIAHGNHAQR